MPHLGPIGKGLQPWQALQNVPRHDGRAMQKETQGQRSTLRNSDSVFGWLHLITL